MEKHFNAGDAELSFLFYFFISLLAGFLLQGYRHFLFLRVVLLVSDATRAQVSQEEHHRGGQHAARGRERASRRGRHGVLLRPASANWTLPVTQGSCNNTSYVSMII